MKALAALALGIITTMTANLPAFAQGNAVQARNIVGSFPWIQSANVEAHQIPLKEGRFARLVIYATKDAQLRFPVTGSLPGLSTILQRELVSGVTAEFLEKSLPKFAATCMGQGDLRVLDLDYLRLAEYGERLAAKVGRAGTHDEENLRRLKEVCETPVWKIKNGKWELTFSVVNQDGAVEKWALAGSSLPASVETLEMRVTRGSGFLTRPVETR